jgi:hypothetical protein
MNVVFRLVENQSKRSYPFIKTVKTTKDISTILKRFAQQYMLKCIDADIRHGYARVEYLCKMYEVKVVYDVKWQVQE